MGIKDILEEIDELLEMEDVNEDEDEDEDEDDLEESKKVITGNIIDKLADSMFRQQYTRMMDRFFPEEENPGLRDAVEAAVRTALMQTFKNEGFSVGGSAGLNKAMRSMMRGDTE